MKNHIIIEMDGLTGEHLSEMIEMHLGDQDPNVTRLLFSVELLWWEFHGTPSIMIKSRPRIKG